MNVLKEQTTNVQLLSEFFLLFHFYKLLFIIYFSQFNHIKFKVKGFRTRIIYFYKGFLTTEFMKYMCNYSDSMVYLCFNHFELTYFLLIIHTEPSFVESNPSKVSG